MAVRLGYKADSEMAAWSCARDLACLDLYFNLRLLRLSLLCWRQKGPSCIAASIPFAKRADAFADSLQQAPPPFCHPDYLAAVSTRGARGAGFAAQAYHNFPRALAAVSKETEHGLGTNRLPALPPADYRETLTVTWFYNDKRGFKELWEGLSSLG